METPVTKPESSSPTATIKIVHEDSRDSSIVKSTILERIRTLTEFIRALAWPFLIACLIIAYRAPLGTMLNALAGKFSEANKVSIWSLSLEIQEKAREVGSPELAEKVGGLSPQAIEALLRISKTGTFILVGQGQRDATQVYTLPNEVEIKALLELESKGLIEFREKLSEFLPFFRGLGMKPTEGAPDRDTFTPNQPLTDDQAKRLLNQGYSLTDLGRQAVEAILKAVVSQLQSQDAKSRKPTP